jgi:hypothetical protein
MSVARSLWAAVQGDPVFMRRVNGFLAVFWVAMIPISYAFGWLNSVTYVSALSLWALVSGHWSTWQAARVEVTQQQEADKLDKNPIEDRVLDKLVAETDIEPSYRARSDSLGVRFDRCPPARWQVRRRSQDGQLRLKGGISHCLRASSRL